MYDGFSDTSKHYVKWVRITKEFLKLAFTGGHCEASFPCSRCGNRRMLSEYEMSGHLPKKGFMANYLLWHQHGEVRLAIADESDGNDDADRMDDMAADIGKGYDLESEDPPSEVRNFNGSLLPQKKKCTMHRYDHVVGCDPSYGVEIIVQLLESVIQQYCELHY
jgi:hypothetical protein